MNKVVNQSRLRKQAEVFTICGGVAAIIFPLFGYYLGYVQTAYYNQYQTIYAMTEL